MKKLLLFAALLFAPALFAQQYPQTPNVGLAANRPVNCNAINPVQPNQPDWYFSTDTQALSICKAQNTWSNVNGGGGGGGCTVPGTSGALLYDTVTGCSDTTGIAYSFPGSVPTLTFSAAGATNVINPTRVIVTDASGNFGQMFAGSTSSFGVESASGNEATLATTAVQSTLVLELDGNPAITMTANATTENISALESPAPSVPPATEDLIYFDSTTHNLTCLRSTGASCLPSSVPGGASGTLQFNNGGVFGGVPNSIGNTPTNGFTLSDGSSTLLADPSNGLSATDTTPEFCRVQGGELFCANGSPASPTNPSVLIQQSQILVSDATGNAEAIIANNGTFGLGFSGAGGSSGSFTLNGATSGLAAVGVAAAAGSPHAILLPTTSGGAGQMLSTDGNNPQQTSWTSTGGMPQFSSYTISAASGTYSARNNTTGVVDATGTDAGALIQTAISNMSSAGTCGTIYLKTPPSSAVYNINTLSTESTGGFTNTYAIGIPGAVSSGQYCQWTIQGEGAPATVNQFDSTGVQATGTTLYITPTAVTSAGASTVEIAGIWARPDTVNGAGATVILKNIEVRFPTNQRGCETGIDLTQALNTFRDNVTTDFNIAPGSLAYPVAGAGCTGGITASLVGQTTTASSKEENTISNSYSVGYTVNWDIESEHTVLVNVFGLNGNHCVDYGVRGGTLSAPSSWMNVGCVWQTVGLTLGANMAAGSLLDISGMTFEDENGGTFPTTTHAIETNAGNTRGRISYSRSLSGTGNTTLANMFDGGGGTAFAFQGNGVTNYFTTRTIAAGTATLGTGAISSGACASVVTVAGTGIATTDDIIADFNADPTSTTGYQATSAGMLTIIKYPTSGDVNFKVCNNTGGSITPGAVTLNWRVVR